jgi:hypothetical protein
MKNLIVLFFLVFLLSACVASETMPTQDINALVDNAVATALATNQPNEATSEATNTSPTPIAAMATTEAPTAMPAEATEAGGWKHISVSSLPTPQGYPGWIRMANAQQSDGLPRDVELTVRQGQIALIFGDEAQVPGMPVETVGANNEAGGCYLLVVVGPAVWDTQPGDGEWPPFHWPGRSAWDLHDVDGADPFVWASQKSRDLQASYPDTCGVDIDLWVYNP